MIPQADFMWIDPDLFFSLNKFWILIAILLFPIQLFITAPYGRHISRTWGYLIDNRLGWVIMEIVSPTVFLFFLLTGVSELTTPVAVFAVLWFLHYLNRSLTFPWRTRSSGKKIPLTIVGSAIFFNCMNGFFNGYYLGNFSQQYDQSWFFEWNFIFGLALFLGGAFINIQSDEILINLRKPGETGYKIPKGGLFHRLSCPNHFGEIVEWTGFALMCWNISALSFAIWTAANLIPRALSHHRWYKSHFTSYPAERKAVLTFLI